LGGLKSPLPLFTKEGKNTPSALTGRHPSVRGEGTPRPFRTPLCERGIRGKCAFMP